MTKESAKERIRIPELWAHFRLPGKPSKCGHSPFRKDRDPSFSVFDDGKAWNDFATGEGGDVIDFLAKIQGTARILKVRAFLDFAAAFLGESLERHAPEAVPARGFSGNGNIADTSSNALESTLGSLREPDLAECHAIAASRGLSTAAVDLAARIGTLLVGTVGGYACWILTDQKRRCAEARRIDGACFPAVGSLGKRKAHTLKGSRKDWPIGILPRLANHRDIRRILFVEGGPDYLAAMHVSILGGCNVLPVAILGAACAKNGFHPEAATLFRRRHVRIVAHCGKSAASEWFAALDQVGCTVDIFEANEPDAKDLNDLVRIKSDDEITKILP